MAVYKIFPSKDATMYSITSSKNTGLDEILELTIDNTSGGGPYQSRFLIQFDPTEINDVINNIIDGNNYQANLRVYNAEANNLTSDITLDIYTVYNNYNGFVNGFWYMGTGKYLSDPVVTNGVSWTYMRAETSPWPTTTTGSYEVSYSNVVGGGAWFTSSLYKFSQDISYYKTKDINVNVTDTVEAWYNGDIPSGNNGFIIKIHNDIYYTSINDSPSLKYFSRDTHTIYPPCLEFKWNNSSFNPSAGISELSTLPAFIDIAENPGVFYPESINRFRVNARPEYPTRVFQTASYYTQNYYLDYSSTCYAIKDLDTNEYVIDFDTQFTRLSIDGTGSYFDLYMNGLEPERYYSILIKTTINGSTIVFDNNYNFKVING